MNNERSNIMKELKTSPLKWEYKNMILELSVSRLRYKVYNDKNQVEHSRLNSW